MKDACQKREYDSARRFLLNFIRCFEKKSHKKRRGNHAKTKGIINRKQENVKGLCNNEHNYTFMF